MLDNTENQLGGADEEIKEDDKGNKPHSAAVPDVPIDLFDNEMYYQLCVYDEKVIDIWKKNASA